MSESDLNSPEIKTAPEEEIASIINRIKTLEQARDTEDDIGYKQRQLRFNKWLTVLTGFLVLTSLVSNYISITASNAAKKSADAATTGVSVAQQGLELNKASLQKTFAEMEVQSNAAQVSAEAAKVQAETNKMALKSSIEISRTDQRAWILNKGIKFGKDLKAGELNPISMTITNAGKTPAQHVRFKFISHMKVQDKPDIVMTEVREEDLALGPGREFEFVFDTDPPKIDQASIEEFESKKRVLTLFVEVSYQDIFKNSHRTGICEFYGPELKPDFTLCPTGNYVE